MESLPLEVKEQIWCHITSDEDRHQCALVNWSWYCHFVKHVIDVSKVFQNFSSEKVEWFNRAYGPFVTELKVGWLLNSDAKKTDIQLPNVKRIQGTSKSLVSAIEMQRLINFDQLQSVVIEFVGDGGSDDGAEKINSQLFELLAESNVSQLIFRYSKFMDAKSIEELNDKATKFLGQLTDLDLDGSGLGIKLFNKLTCLENLAIRDMTNYIDAEGYDEMPQYEDYIEQIISSMNSHAKNLKSVTIEESRELLEGLAEEGLWLGQLAQCGKVESISFMDRCKEDRVDVNVFTYNIDHIKDFTQFQRIRELRGPSIEEASTLSKLGLACRQLEKIQLQIEVDLTQVKVPDGTVLFPNLLWVEERLVSVNRKVCVCHFVRAHMPNAKFYGYGAFCYHCNQRSGEYHESELGEEYPRWTGFNTTICPNFKDLLYMYLGRCVPYNYFESCL